jgi:hypothetical protein
VVEHPLDDKEPNQIFSFDHINVLIRYFCLSYSKIVPFIILRQLLLSLKLLLYLRLTPNMLAIALFYDAFTHLFYVLDLACFVRDLHISEDYVVGFHAFEVVDVLMLSQYSLF